MTSRKANSDSLHLLVFDDDLVHHQDFLKHVEARFTYRPHADQAVSEVRAHQPDVVLMDYSMGTPCSGAQAVSNLREHFSADSLPILAISSDARCNEMMLMAGASASCVKIGLPTMLPGWLENGCESES